MKQKYGFNKKVHTKGYIIGLVIFVLLIILSSQIATQYIAEQLLYHKALGEPIIYNFYQPFAWANWSINFFYKFPVLFEKVYYSLAFSLIGILIIFYIIRILFSRSAEKHEDVHGTAKWATIEDIKECSLLEQSDGVYVGGFQDEKGQVRYLRHNGPEHSLVFAPTRSGKGVGLVIPTLLSWKESLFVLDIKGENWALSSKWRQEYANNKVMKFDPTSDSQDTVRFNPLEEIRLNTIYEVSDTQNLALIIVDPKGQGLNTYWDKSAFTFTSAFILHVLYKKLNEENSCANLTDLYNYLNNPNLDLEELLNEMMTYPHVDGKTHNIIATAGKEASNKVSEELSGVIGTVTSNLGLYGDPLIARNIEKSDFRIDDLMNYDTPVSLYLNIDPESIERLSPLNRIIVTQIVKKSMRKMEYKNAEQIKKYKYRLLLLLDEFTSLGKLEIFEKSLAFMAGYGIKSYLIIQDSQQLFNVYGKEESIISNCHIRIAYAPNKIETAKTISDMTGTTTVVKSYTTTSGSRISPILGHVSESYQEVSRPLLTPGEVMTLPKPIKDSKENIIEAGDMLIFVAGSNPIYGKQILYFKDKTFLARAKLGSAISDKTKDIVTSNKDGFKLQCLN